MKFDDLDATMRQYETAHDRCVPPGVYVVARLDGRGFTRLTKELHAFERPFDLRFHHMMLDTAEHLMAGGGVPVAYGYVQSDEISLLLPRDVTAFGRRVRKYNSVLAGEASAKFSLLLGDVACFDCRMCELPDAERVRDYFRWRSEDARRNALSAHCYWALRKAGSGPRDAEDRLQGLSSEQKKALLEGHGVRFGDLAPWQKQGVGLLWEDYERPALNPKTGETVAATRRRIRRETELPEGDAYARFIADRLTMRL